MVMGRPKLEVKRDRQLNLKLTNLEFEKISKIAQKLGITKTDAIIRAIDLLSNPPRQKIYRPLNKNPKKHSVGSFVDDD